MREQYSNVPLPITNNNNNNNNNNKQTNKQITANNRPTDREHDEPLAAGRKLLTDSATNLSETTSHARMVTTEYTHLVSPCTFIPFPPSFHLSLSLSLTVSFSFSLSLALHVQDGGDQWPYFKNKTTQHPWGVPMKTFTISYNDKKILLISDYQ